MANEIHNAFNKCRVQFISYNKLYNLNCLNIAGKQVFLVRTKLQQPNLNSYL
jgi:hypothetical protein